MNLCSACCLIGDDKLDFGELPCSGCILSSYFDDALVFNKITNYYFIKMSLTPHGLREKFHSLESQGGVNYVRRFIPELIREIEHLDQKLSVSFEKKKEVDSMVKSRYVELGNVQKEYNQFAGQYNELVASLGKHFTEMSMAEMFAKLPDEEHLSTAISPYSKALFYEDLGKGSLFYESIELSPEKPSGETSLLWPPQRGRRGLRLPRKQQPIQWGRHVLSPEKPSGETSLLVPFQWGRRRLRLPRTRRMVFEFDFSQYVQQYVDLDSDSRSEGTSDRDDPDYHP